MDSELVRTVGESYEQNPDDVGLRSVAEDEGRDHEHHREKKSVLKKVKDKAKKIKDTLEQHDHGHGGHVLDDHDVDEEEDEEEMSEHPKVRGAPIYEYTAIRCTSIPGQVQSSGQSMDPMIEDPPAPASVIPGTYKDSDPSKTLLHEQERPGQRKVNPERPKHSEEGPHGPNVRSDPSNYQTEVTDPTSTVGEDAGITPILYSLGKMNISEGAEHEHVTEQKQNQFTPQADAHEGEETTKAGSAVEYGKKIVATVTEKLNPVYDKVTETGSAVMSEIKVPQSTDAGNGDESEGEVKGHDKEASMRDYLRSC